MATLIFVLGGIIGRFDASVVGPSQSEVIGVETPERRESDRTLGDHPLRG